MDGCESIYAVWFFIKQKATYDLRTSDWSSDVCSSDLDRDDAVARLRQVFHGEIGWPVPVRAGAHHGDDAAVAQDAADVVIAVIVVIHVVEDFAHVSGQIGSAHV